MLGDCRDRKPHKMEERGGMGEGCWLRDIGGEGSRGYWRRGEEGGIGGEGRKG